MSAPREAKPPRVYAGSTILEIVDGDTVRVDIDLGFDMI